MSYPAVGAPFNHRLTRAKPDVCGEEPAQREDGPLPMNTPAAIRTSPVMKSGQRAAVTCAACHCAAASPPSKPPNDPGDDSHKCPALRSRSAGIDESAAEAHRCLAQREQAEEQPEGELGSRLLVEGCRRGHAQLIFLKA